MPHPKRNACTMTARFSSAASRPSQSKRSLLSGTINKLWLDDTGHFAAEFVEHAALALARFDAHLGHRCSGAPSGRPRNSALSNQLLARNRGKPALALVLRRRKNPA